MTEKKSVVYTVHGLCSICYTCVRDCPAKAIRISHGQAEVIPERCIQCGTCTKVCNQGAKQFVIYTDEVSHLLSKNNNVVAILDSAFPGEFYSYSAETIVGMLKKLGFSHVVDTASGGDWVANEYGKIYNNSDSKPTISANCPVVVSYVEKYHPALVHHLAPIISPVSATARIVKQKYGSEVKTVYIGACIARKNEIDKEFDSAISFVELRELWRTHGIDETNSEPATFDPPYGGKGGIWVLRRGMLKAIGIDDNLLTGNVISANGRVDFREALKEFEDNALNGYHLDLLGCKGCIRGAGMSKRKRQFSGTMRVSSYIRAKIAGKLKPLIEQESQEPTNINLTRNFVTDDQRLPTPSKQEIKTILTDLGKIEGRNFLNCGACGYATCVEHSIAVFNGLAEAEMCLPFAINKLHKSVEDLAVSNKKLASIKEVLKQNEKLASMGQLSAGIAHELNNPLGVVIMYSNILLEESSSNVSIYKDLKLIVDQAERCKRIVGGLLNFARKNQVQRKEVNVKDLVQTSISSIIVPANIEIDIQTHDVQDEMAMLDSEQITQVLNNLVNNAIDAMPQGGKIQIKVKDTEKDIIIEVNDTGVGIAESNLNQIFEPFYTTKETGKGTGLGLATTYGIVKMHKGNIQVQSNCDSGKGQTGTTFKVQLPRDASNS